MLVSRPTMCENSFRNSKESCDFAADLVRVVEMLKEEQLLRSRRDPTDVSCCGICDKA